MQQNERLGTMPVGPLFRRLAIPMVAARLAALLYTVVDRAWLGHIPGAGDLALTGVGLCIPMAALLQAFANLVGMGGAPHVSRLLGAGDPKRAEGVVGSCMTAAVVVSVALMAVCLLGTDPLLRTFGASDATLPYARQYLRIYAAGMLFTVISLGMNAFITAQGFARVSMLTTVLGAALNLVLDPLFIFGLNMGVRGAALATVIAEGAAAVWVLRFLIRSKRAAVRLRLRNMSPDWSLLGPALALGLSPFIMEVTESLLSVCFNTSLQRYGGDIAVHSMTIMTTTMLLLTRPLMGLGQGAQPIVGFNLGTGDFGRVKQGVRVAILCSFCYAVAFWAFNMLCPAAIPSLFAPAGPARDHAAWAMRIFLAGGFMMGLQFPCQSLFVSLGEAKRSLFLALLRKVILLLPLLYTLPHLFADKVFAVFLTEPLIDVTAACVTVTLFLRTMKRLGRSMQPPAGGPRFSDQRKG